MRPIYSDGQESTKLIAKDNFNIRLFKNIFLHFPPPLFNEIVIFDIDITLVIKFVSYKTLRANENVTYIVCRLLIEKKKYT